jgi:hypothetical protein
MLTSTCLLDGESGALVVEAHVDELFQIGRHGG